MQIISQYFVQLADWLQPYLFKTCMAQVATILVVYSRDIDKSVRTLLKPHPFALRVIGFVLINAFGYGFVTLTGGGLLRQFYLQIGAPVRVPLILAVFIAIGILAERRKHI